ncbi:hypothetical protein LguiB_007115 [Lonicera macranthoides]
MSQPKGKIEETPKTETKNEMNMNMNMNMNMKDGTTTSSSVPFKFNAQAPEFVPRSHTTTTHQQMPISGYFYPYFHYFAGSTGGSDWIYVGGGDQDSMVSSTSTVIIPNYGSKDVLSQDLQDKIVRQVEYQFSGMSLIANESLAKQINKDPEVPIAVIASTKKIKSLINNNNLLAQALRSSSKLVVSNDGKKVRRKDPFTDREKEELQAQTVVAENLPEDHSHQNLKKIFSVVGSVKTIRICHPQESNSSRSKGDFVISNKLHALVEYETTEIAEKAVEKLNDERNWRKGLRVRLLLRCSPKSVLKRRKSDFDGYFDCEDEVPTLELSEDSSQPSYSELTGDNNGEESSAGSKKGWGRGRGKSRPRSQTHNGSGLTSPSGAQSSCSSFIQCETSSKQVTRGPRMPDGTRGFTMGRGKPLSVTIPSTSAFE